MRGGAVEYCSRCGLPETMHTLEQCDKLTAELCARIEATIAKATADNAKLPDACDTLALLGVK